MAATVPLRILVAGAAGQVGEPLAVELRRRGHDVYALIRDATKGKQLVKGEVKLVIGSIDDQKVIESVIDKVDVIINSTSQFGNLNLDKLAFEAITGAIKKNGGANKKKVIFLSGGLVYAGNPPVALTEEAPTSTSPYVVPRLETEKAVIKSQDFHGAVARLPMVLGGDRSHWTLFYEQAKAGKLEVFGDGSNIISYGHIDDLVSGIIAIAEGDSRIMSGQIYNVAEFHKDKPVSLKDIAQAFAKGAGFPNVPVEFIPWDEKWKIFNVNVWMDTTKLETALGWKAHHNVIEDAKVMYDSWKEYNVPAKWY